MVGVKSVDYAVKFGPKARRLDAMDNDRQMTQLAILHDDSLFAVLNFID